jgi:argininosuccinate synthase
MIKSQMADWYGTWLHEALFLDPVMRDIEKLMENSQKNVTGKVFIAFSLSF